MECRESWALVLLALAPGQAGDFGLIQIGLPSRRFRRCSEHLVDFRHSPVFLPLRVAQKWIEPITLALVQLLESARPARIKVVRTRLVIGFVSSWLLRSWHSDCCLAIVGLS